MRKALGLIVIMVAAATVVAGTEDKKPAPSIDGTYLIVAIEKGGEKISDEILKKQPESGRIIVIKEDKLTPTGKDKVPVMLKLDPTKTPAEITMTETKGDKPETSYGIYKLEGDTLTICMVEDDKAANRPKEFKTTKESKAIMLTLKKRDK